jgi:hypothetical protein
VIRKSQAQRDRESHREADRTKRAAALAVAEEQRESVRIYNGDPFAPAGDVAEVAATTLEKPPPEPPFKLAGTQRQELLQGLLPRITFPKDKPCPTSLGEVYTVTAQFAFVVIGIGETKSDWLLHYQPLDRRSRHLGKAGDYCGSERGAIATTKGIEDQPLGGPQFRPEKEQEPVSKREQTKMSEEDRAERLTQMRGNLKILQDNLGRLERLGEPSDVCWGVRRAITALKARIERQAKQQKEARAA